MVKPKKDRTPEEEERVREANRLIQEREKLASKQGISSKEAGRAMVAGEDVRAKKAETERLIQSPESQQLAERQSLEIQNLESLRSLSPQLSVPERNIEAGQAAVRGIQQTLGLPQGAVPIGSNIFEDLGMIEKKVGLTVLGKVSSTKIFGWSVADLFTKSNQGNIENLQSDISSLVTESNRIARVASTRGADINQAISSLSSIEAAVRARYNDALISLRASPTDMAEGLDFMDDASSNLRIIIEQRQALERYRLTGDINQVIGLGIE